MNEEKSKRKIEIKNIDYRHYISVLLTIIFIVFGVVYFPNAICRLIEACRDLCLSTAYYFAELLFDEHSITVTVNDLPSWQIATSRYQPLQVLPFEWSDFKIRFAAYWDKWASWDTFKSYLHFLSDLLYIVSQVLVFALPLCFVVAQLLRQYLRKHNNDYDEESRPLRIFKRISDFSYQRLKKFLLSYISFLKEKRIYVTLWLVLWTFYFNFITIFVEFIAYYLYFVPSFDTLNLYRQLYKLCLDLTTVVRFVPVILWVFCVFGILEYWARSCGYNTLSHREARNCGFVASLGVMTVVYGPMGAGKTKFITDMALTEEVRMRDMAFEIILESDLKFPNMNWATFEKSVRKMIRKHVIFSLPTARRWVRSRYHEWQRMPNKAKLFGYDYERYGLDYNDNLKVQNLWEVLDDYACAYLIYTVQSSLLVSNYSIRTDALCEDLGNFPLWNSDFFRRDSRLIDSYSRHAHILDFDILRLGKRVLRDNPNRYAFGFGVWVISEIDKERKNTLELKNVDPASEEANQKNDLFNMLLKMSRHAAVVANRVFVKFFADLQRPESLGADARELGQVVYIDAEQSDGGMSPVLPFFSPFYVIQAAVDMFFGKFVKLYYDYRFIRSDKTLPMYVLKNVVAGFEHYIARTENLFGSSKIKLQIESGRMDGQTREKVYFEQSKKIYARRYGTDCLNGIFELYAKNNTIGIDDLPEYMTYVGKDDENLMQHSFFQMEVHKHNRVA